MKRRFFEVVNTGDPKVGEIRIYGVIGAWWDGNDAESFVSAFKLLEKTCTRINVKINSPGGSVAHGLPIYNAIKSSAREVHTYVDGIAMSMGAIILFGAKKGRVHMAKGSLLMIHSVSTYTSGNSKDLRAEADVLDTYDNVLASLIADRASMTVEDVKDDYLNHEDHYFTPAEAKELGLIDVIEDYEASEAPENIQNMSYGQIAAWYENQAQDPSPGMITRVANKVKDFFNNSDNNDEMFGNKLNKLTALAKVAAESITNEQLEDVNAQLLENGVKGVSVVLDSELKEIADENDTLKSEKTALEAEKETLETEKSNLETKIADLEAKLAKAEGKPAKKPAVAKSEGDTIPEGEDNDKDLYMTSIDAQADQMYG